MIATQATAKGQGARPRATIDGFHGAVAVLERPAGARLAPGDVSAAAAATPAETVADAEASAARTSPSSDDAPLSNLIASSRPRTGRGRTAAAAAPAAVPERTRPHDGETLLVVTEAYVAPILDGTKTLLTRPWRMRGVGRWFLSTRGLIRGKISLGEPFKIRDAATWKRHASHHMEGRLMRYRAGYCWAYPISHPIRLAPLHFPWTAGALLMCKYRDAAAPPHAGGACGPIEVPSRSLRSRTSGGEASGAPTGKRCRRALTRRKPCTLGASIAFVLQASEDALKRGKEQRRARGAIKGYAGGALATEQCPSAPCQGR